MRERKVRANRWRARAWAQNRCRVTHVPGELGTRVTSLTEIEICEAHPRLRVCLVERDGLEERLARSLRPLVGERALRLVEREEQNFRI